MSEPQIPKRGIVLGVKSTIKSQPFPYHRTYRWTPIAARDTAPPDVALVVSQEVLYRTNKHVSESLDHEIGGFLLGNRFRCPETQREYVIIDQLSPAQFTESTSVTLAFTMEAWAKLTDEMNGKFVGKLLVGWYHSHPKMNIFLSQSDVPIHERRFSDLYMSALVIDPAKQLGGFFARRAGKLDPLIPVEFFEYLGRPLAENPESCMNWNGYVGQNPITDQEISPTRVAKPVAVPSPERAPAAPAVPDAPAAERRLTHSSEAISQPFPSERTYHWLPKEAAASKGPEIALVVSQDVLNAVQRQVGESLDYEIGGFLLGNRYRCPNSGVDYVVVDQHSPAHFTEATAVSLAFTAGAWGKLDDELSGKFLGKALVGWYHSHPKMGIFLSSWDIELHEKRFPDPWMSALVIDPDRHTGGFFCQRDGHLDARLPVDFYELRDSIGPGPSESAIPWADYTCQDPVTGAEISPTRKKIDLQAPPGEHRPLPMVRPGTPVPMPATSAPSSRSPMLLVSIVAGVLVLAGGTFFAMKLAKHPPPQPPPAATNGVTYHLDVINASADANHRDDGVTLELAIRPRRPLKDTQIFVENEPVIEPAEIPSDEETLKVRAISTAQGVLSRLKDLQSTSNMSIAIRVADENGRPLATNSFPLSAQVFPPPPPDPTKKNATGTSLVASSRAPAASPREPPRDARRPVEPLVSTPPPPQAASQSAPHPTPAPSLPAPPASQATATPVPATGFTSQQNKAVENTRSSQANPAEGKPAEKPSAGATQVGGATGSQGTPKVIAENKPVDAPKTSNDKSSGNGPAPAKTSPLIPIPPQKDVPKYQKASSDARGLQKDLNDCLKKAKNQNFRSCKEKKLDKIHHVETDLSVIGLTARFPDLRRRITLLEDTDGADSAALYQAITWLAGEVGEIANKIDSVVPPSPRP